MRPPKGVAILAAELALSPASASLCRHTCAAQLSTRAGRRGVGRRDKRLCACLAGRKGQQLAVANNSQPARRAGLSPFEGLRAEPREHMVQFYAPAAAPNAANRVNRSSRKKTLPRPPAFSAWVPHSYPLRAGKALRESPSRKNAHVKNRVPLSKSDIIHTW